MKECMVYAKDRKTILCSAFGCMFSIGIAGIIVLPYFMGQWSYDRRIGPLHMILGGVCFCVGIILLYLLFKKYISRTSYSSTKSRVVSCIMGGIGWGIAKTGRLDQEQIKWLIYLLSGFCQNMIRVGFIYLLMEQFYERNWKEDIFMGKRAIAVLLGLCVIMTLPAFLPERNLQSGVTLLCQCIFLMGLIVYFGNRAWRKNINEKVG